MEEPPAPASAPEPQKPRGLRPQDFPRARKIRRKLFGRLPEWVIGCYDGPSDGKLSQRKAFEE